MFPALKASSWWATTKSISFLLFIYSMHDIDLKNREIRLHMLHNDSPPSVIKNIFKSVYLKYSWPKSPSEDSKHLLCWRKKLMNNHNLLCIFPLFPWYCRHCPQATRTQTSTTQAWKNIGTNGKKNATLILSWPEKHFVSMQQETYFINRKNHDIIASSFIPLG